MIKRLTLIRPFSYLALLIAFSSCYLEWGGGNSTYIFEIIRVVFVQRATWRDNLSHPIILFGIGAHIMILFSVFWQGSPKWLSLSGRVILAIVVAFVSLIGLVSRNNLMVLRSIPFWLVVIFIFYIERDLKKSQK